MPSAYTNSIRIDYYGRTNIREMGAAFPPRPAGRGLHAANLMKFPGTPRLRRGRVSRWLAGVTAVSLCALAGAYWVPQIASAAGPGGAVAAPPLPRGATVLPD